MPDSPASHLVDSHCHLNHPRLLRRLSEALARAEAAGVSDMVVVGYDLPSSRRAVELAAQHDGLWATVGIHPHDAGAVSDHDYGELRSLARSDKVVAIGETGLDFYRDLSPRDAQMQAFERHLDLAAELGLPAVIHCRDAQEAVLATVRKRVKPAPGADAALGLQPALIWHCFDGSLDHMGQALAAGLTFGVSGRLTHRTAAELRQVVARIPLARLLLETDAPYLAPEPRRSRDNEPGNLPLVAQALAAARGDRQEEIAAATSENARRVFAVL
jgi:TatD DNase family protein